MKQLPQGGEEWIAGLVNDLAYIKRHLRYPVKKATVLPVIMWTSFILLMMVLVSISIYTRVTAGEHIPGITLIMAGTSIILFTVNIARYLQSLKFISIYTGKHLQENIQLTDAFLQSEHLLTYRHPEAPEIFLIQSRNLSAGKEDREVIIFIADDGRILINSHFTNRGWGFSPAERHHRQMAAMLRKYMHVTDNHVSVTHNPF